MNTIETLSTITNEAMRDVFEKEVPLIAESYDPDTFGNGYTEYHIDNLKIIIFKDRGELFLHIGNLNTDNAFYLGTILKYAGININNEIPDIKHIKEQLNIIKTNKIKLLSIFEEVDIDKKLTLLEKEISNKLMSELINKHEK